jgi:5-methylcytosine-specific restriction endonuclease McrA
MSERTKRRKLSKDERKQVYEKCNGHCAYCGAQIEFKEMQVDHVDAFRFGGADTVDNMLPACRSCNHYKSTMDIETFRIMIGRWTDILTRDSVTYRNAVRYGQVTPTPKPVVFYFETLTT